MAMHLVTLELDEQAVSHELDVLLHEAAVHPDQTDGQRGRQELLLDLHRVADYLLNPVRRGLVHQVAEHQTCKVTMKTLQIKF